MFVFLLSFKIASKNKTCIGIVDEELVKGVVEEQDPLMVEALYERYANKVYRRCISLVKDSAVAEDLTQDIFLKMYLNLASFRGTSKFSTWLYSITYNFCIDYLRKSNKLRHSSLEDEMVSVRDIEVTNANDLSHIKTERLTELLELIREDEKTILLMKYRDGLSIKDIQRAFNISESAVKMRIKRAKDKVKLMYDKKYSSR